MQAKCQVDMTYGDIPKQLFMFTIPILLSQILQQFYNIADTAIIGQYVGTDALAAIGSTGLLIAVIVNFFIGLSTGVSAVIANQFGAHEYDKLRKSIATSLSVSIALGIVFTIGSLIFMKPIINLLQTPKDVYYLAVDYLKICFLGITFQLLYNIGTAILRALGNTKDPLYFLVFSCVLNLILDILFIVYFGWGVKGAAIATLVSQILAALLVLWKIMHLDDECRINLKQIRIYKGYIEDIFLIGIPAGLQAIFMSISSLIIQSSINSFGEEAMAGMTVFGKVEGFLYFPLFSLGLAVTGFVGQNFGAKEYERTKKILLQGMFTAFVFLFGGFLLTRFFPNMFVNIFTKDAVLEKICLEGMKIYLMTLPLLGVCVLGPIYFQSIGKIKQSMFLTLLRQVILFIPIISVISKFMGMKGVWMSQPIADILAALIIIVFLIREIKSNKNITDKEKEIA